MREGGRTLNAPLNEIQPSVESEGEISLLDILQVVAENLKLLVLGPLLVGVVALGVAFMIPPSFTATTRFMPPQQQQSAAASLVAGLGALGGLAGAAAGIKNPNDQYMAFIKSETIANSLIERFALEQRYESQFRVDARKELTANTVVSAGKDGLIKLEFADKDPRFAAEVANAYVEELRKLLGRMAVTEAQQRRVFFEGQLEKTKNHLANAERALRDTGVNSSALKSNPQAAVTAVAQLQAQIAAQEIKIGSMRGYLSENAPDFKQALTELASLRAQFAKFEKGTNPGESHGAEGDYVARYREFKYHETLFELFARQYELAKVDEAREGAVIQVVDIAQPPERKSKPKKALIALIAGLAAGFLLLLWVFVRSAWRNAARSPETADKLERLKRTVRGA